MNFVWLDINASWSHSSLALPALHANLEQHTAEKCSMKVVRGTIKSPIVQIVQEVAALQPTYIFATAWLFNINFLNEVLCRVSALCNPHGIFLGGPEFLGDNSVFLQNNTHITAVFKGEGEEIFEPFIKSLLAADNTWRNLPGFEWANHTWVPETKEHSKTLTHTCPTAKTVTVKDFSALRYPEQSELFSWDKSFVQVETSRGCFNSCRFCVSGIEKCPIQNIPIEQLRIRLQEIAAHGIKQVRVLDRTFNGNPNRALQLLELFKEFAGQLNFHLEVHPALLFPASPKEDLSSNQAISGTKPSSNEDLSSNTHISGTNCPSEGDLSSNPHISGRNYVQEGELSTVGKLRKALENVPEGLLHIEAGIQTLRQDVLDTCNRKGSCAQAIKGLEFLIGCKKFEVHADLIAGLPEYSYQHLIEDTLQMMQIGPAEIQLESLKLLHGTYFRINARELGIRYSPAPSYEVLETPHISYRELDKAMVLSKILDMWYNDEKWREPFRKIFAGNLSLMEKMINELQGSDILTQPLSLENKGLLLYRFCKENAHGQAPLISLQWVRNGLSMKKDPAENFIKWEMKDGIQTNPIYVENDPRYKYWHITIGDTRHWFSFNKEIERVAPCRYFSETVSGNISPRASI